MKVHYPKLYNMAHLSLNVITASKGSNNYILSNKCPFPSIEKALFIINAWSFNRIFTVYDRSSSVYLAIW